MSIDFFTVSTLTGRVLFIFVALAHHRRRIVHFNITEHPTATWAAQQIIEACPDDSAPRWLLRDRDAIYGEAFRRRVAGMGIGEVISCPASPWQNAYAERFVRTIKESCLDRMILIGQASLRRAIREFEAHYHLERNHQGLQNQLIMHPTPQRRDGSIACRERLGGLLKYYHRPAA